MTMTTGGVATSKSGERASGRGPARAGTVEHLSRADREARGKDARGAAPLESRAGFQLVAGLLAPPPSVAHVDGGGAKKLKAALAEAQVGMGG